MYAEIREIVDYLVQPMFGAIPRTKINGFAENLANDLLVGLYNERAGVVEERVKKNDAGFWVLRDGEYLCQILVDILEGCCISQNEFMPLIPIQFGFKADIGLVYWLVNNQISNLDLKPYKKCDYKFEFPVRVLHVMLTDLQNRGVTFDTLSPPNFVPLQLIPATELEFSNPMAPQFFCFRAVGIPVHVCMAQDLKALPMHADDCLINGNSPTNVLKIHYFDPGWWTNGMPKTSEAP
ncbi:hypothetical protein M3Y98_00257400 [Aphelenchoides besseyi]|nr:hypothetical protein M3Y98_00257400 [Aphelenchoides besseyi]KAI6200827.1 hypothetical protein M3Y96_00775800 [Aphelenchoides besseyi]